MSAADIADLKRFVSTESAVVEQAMREDLGVALQDSDPFLGEVLEYALFNGGKRIRPLLFVLSARLGGAEGRKMYLLAGAFEYLHVATLIHDDVIDNAARRRGRDSVGRRFGTAAAILAGDWLHARSMYLVGRLAGPDGLEVFCRSTGGMVDGEFLQLRYVADPEITEEQYFAVIHRKTGLLIASTCEIGAVFAGCRPEERQALARYGSCLGAAFQVVDDLLDYQGDAAATGKQVGNDFVEGKLTLPLIRALAGSDAAARQRMAAYLAGDRTDRVALEAVVRFIEERDGFGSARRTAGQLVAEATAALDCFAGTGDGESLGLLRTLAGYVLDRNR